MVFLDTSGLLCILDARSSFHRMAVEHYRSARRILTNNYVLAELIPLANTRKFPREKLHASLFSFERLTDLSTHAE
jgi:predicted nucleic acid-binding protein